MVDHGPRRVAFPSDGVGKESRDQRNQTNECEDPMTIKQHKQSRSRQGYKLRRSVCRRLSRQKFNEKMKTLQEIIPNCSKSGQASILEDTIKYIQKLQYQLHLMMSTRAGCCPIPQSWQPGTQISSFAPFLETIKWSTDKMKYEIATPTPSMLTASGSFRISGNQPSMISPQQSCRRTGGSRSTVRVLPTQIVPPQDHVNEDHQSQSGYSLAAQIQNEKALGSFLFGTNFTS